ncbi:MAG: imidazole glycerol phosphate synthase subunit HisF [Fluviicola sp.]|nr:MAG: imidazole glycerol phosphate synthase subunit HisF [Fluviicola sp.]
MLRPRIIPVLLIQDQYLVKTTKFKNPNYIGDPINAVQIYNDLKADELVFLDIEATKEGRLIDLDFVRLVGEEANMPFSVGGGIRNISGIRNIISAGAERVVIGSYALENPDFVKQASEIFGVSTICVCIDVKKSLLKGQCVWSKNGKKSHKYTPVEFARLMEKNGAGEIIIQSIDRDGSMTGYDISLLKKVSETVTIPVIALGGAQDIEDLKKCFKEAYISGVAAGSLFVYYDSNKGVLINYPEEKRSLFF